jgi:hypothetical protein
LVLSPSGFSTSSGCVLELVVVVVVVVVDAAQPDTEISPRMVLASAILSACFSGSP